MARIVLAASLALFVALPAAQANEASDKVISGAIEGFIRPAYGKLVEATATLGKSLATLCAAPSDDNLDAAREQFSKTTATWSEIEIIRFGPITEQNRLERILFWPDRKGTGLKHVQAALADKDETATDAARLAQKSVAMQGLGALEFVLFGTGADDLTGAEGAYRCAYGKAISGNIGSIASEVDAAWRDDKGFAAQWKHPGAENPLYRDATEAVTELLEVYVNGLELVRDVRVNGFLGEEANADKPKQALYWRSQGTAASLGGNISGMKALFDASKFGSLLSDDSQWVAQSIEFEFANAQNAVAAVSGPIDAALADAEKRGKLGYFGVVTSSLSELFGTRLAGALGLTAGFSSLDGD
ncbi:imelysin family protein [Aminobacter niigataensis]|uniref:imelysin family protein n=1 Tax=Aminobacter niigataensis TaxID=83265 RepID=UPI0024C7033B|nr:imelysin family protein [Aminobacter niigataensis]CAI2931675.1 Iron-regulated protein A precursor [Aminobacter niigataensis]